jgi:hypothetical protein
MHLMISEIHEAYQGKIRTFCLDNNVGADFCGSALLLNSETSVFENAFSS